MPPVRMKHRPLLSLLCRIFPAIARYNAKDKLGVHQLRGVVTASYLVVVLRTGATFGAFFPDLPGCVATSTSLSGVKTRICEAAAAHVLGMLEDDDDLPTPITALYQCSRSEKVEQAVVSVRVPLPAPRDKRPRA